MRKIRIDFVFDFVDALPFFKVCAEMGDLEKAALTAYITSYRVNLSVHA